MILHSAKLSLGVADSQHRRQIPGIDYIAEGTLTPNTTDVPTRLVTKAACTSETPADPNPVRAAFWSQTDDCLNAALLRKKEIHAVSDAIAKFMADNPHTI